MAAIASLPPAADHERRSLLAVSDELLDEIELLRLDDRQSVPSRLVSAIGRLQERLGRDAPAEPRTLKSAHDLIFAVQQRLMASNPRNAITRSHAGRGSGQFVTMRVATDVHWKLLALPSLPPGGIDMGWLELVEETVERACDRWSWAHHLAVTEARQGGEASAALARARIAWENYWELRQEADEMHRRGLRLAPG